MGLLLDASRDEGRVGALPCGTAWFFIGGEMEQRIVRLLEEKGPLTGSEILDGIRETNLLVWRTCRLSTSLRMRVLGARYLRLDRRVDGYARLSPSILREFMTYTVVGLPGAEEALDHRADRIVQHLREVSNAKGDLARSMVGRLHDKLGKGWPQDGRLCFILAGDIVYGMAHDVSRPELSTGELVNGSDIDLVVVADDSIPDDFLEKLDRAIYQEKYLALILPGVREELDYVVKKMGRVREQLCFDTFKRMVACKILLEGILLQGSRSLFEEIKSLLVQRGIVSRLNEMEIQAGDRRKQAEEYLLHADPAHILEGNLHLFYTGEETEEFE